MKGGEKKMNKIVALLVIAGIAAFVFVSPANSVTSTGSIPVTADVTAGTPDMSFEIHKLSDGDPDQDPWTNYTVETSMVFDKWDVLQRPSKAAQWASVTKNTVIVWATGLGDDYEIYSDGSGAMSGTGGTLPAGSLMVTPIYSSTDKWDPSGPGQGGMPSGSSLGNPAKALQLGNLVYSSESPVGSARILQVMYMFPAYNMDGTSPYTGYEPIPTSTSAGSYSGANIVIRIVAK